MALKFIDSEPPSRRGGTGETAWGGVRDELRAHPGQWAELGIWPKASRRKAQNIQHTISKRYPDIQAVVRTIGDDVVVYARAVTP